MHFFIYLQFLPFVFFFLFLTRSVPPPPFIPSRAIQVVEASANGRKLPTGGYVDLVVCPWLSTHLGENHPPTDRQNRQWQRTLHGKKGGGDIWSHDTCNSNNNRYDFKSGNNDNKKWKSKEKNSNAEVFLSLFPLLFHERKRYIASFCFLILLDIYLCVCLKD